jgi:iron complex outermembrane receptor protein
MGASGGVFAQDEEQREEARGATTTLLEEVVVTARKREEQAQDVPIAVSAYSGAQLEALKIRDLRGLSVAMPNVAMDDIATTRGVANFSIRGLGINSSIPGIDPTVGVFIDGVYQAQNSGVVVDMFDIASIEVLRGPQGTLFGRNVTGGAVLINTKRPGDEFELSMRAAVDGNSNGDGGLNYYVMGSVGGPLGDTFGARIGLYYNEDDGWFENLYTGRNHGQSSTTIIRPSFLWTPTDDFQIDLRWEHFETDGDGPASQSHINGSGVQCTFVQAY